MSSVTGAVGLARALIRGGWRCPAPFDRSLEGVKTRFAKHFMRYKALATDYDGTLATDGRVDEFTLEAVRNLRASGRKFLLVTGRELPELKTVFPQLDLCDAVVAENGGLLFWPAQNREQILAEPPPAAFLEEMRRRHVEPCSVGRVIFAAWRPHEVEILETIQKLGIGYQIIFNKRAVMVLPSNVNKASGLAAALRQLDLTSEHVVGIGDAENDHAFLETCAVAAAVQNALPALKSRCDLVTQADHGRGVAELIAKILSDDLESLGPRRARANRPIRS
jgi:hydroxymethylpyrimidine pyrophosphatase-like HAD family hydrolase